MNAVFLHERCFSARTLFFCANAALRLPADTCPLRLLFSCVRACDVSGTNAFLPGGDRLHRLCGLPRPRPAPTPPPHRPREVHARYTHRTFVHTHRASVYTSRASVHTPRASVYTPRAFVRTHSPSVHTLRASVHTLRASVHTHREHPPHPISPAPIPPPQFPRPRLSQGSRAMSCPAIGQSPQCFIAQTTLVGSQTTFVRSVLAFVCFVEHLCPRMPYKSLWPGRDGRHGGVRDSGSTNAPSGESECQQRSFTTTPNKRCGHA
jgi:hypothetical protein